MLYLEYTIIVAREPDWSKIVKKSGAGGFKVGATLFTVDEDMAEMCAAVFRLKHTACYGYSISDDCKARRLLQLL